jgi:GTPases - translation elongation factors
MLLVQLNLPEVLKWVCPGDILHFEVELLAPICMNNNLRFAIRESGRTVGSGVVQRLSNKIFSAVILI